MKDIRKKIIVIGIPDSGKTSIVNALRGIKSFKEYVRSLPTRYTDKFLIMEENVIIWDCGGAMQIREKILIRYKIFFEKCDEIKYIINVQDTYNYALVLEYFEQIVEKLVEYGYSPKLTIYLHKYDIGLETSEPDLVEKEIPELQKKIEALIPEEFEHEFIKSRLEAHFVTL